MSISGALADPSIGELPVTRIEPAKSRLRLREVITAWPVVKVIAVRDLKARYKQSLLGPLWILFQPLALLAGFIVGFRGVTHVTTGGVPYALFALAGVTMWSFFQAGMIAGTSSILSNGALVRKTACPRFAFPIAALLAVLPSFLLPCLAAMTWSVVSGRASLRYLLLPVVVLWLLATIAGIVAISSAVSVRFRDLVSALPFLLQVGAFLVPVGYPVSTLGHGLRLLVSLNPLTGVIEAWRWVVLDTNGIYLPSIYISLALVGVLVAFGWRVFARFEVKMADVI